MSKQHNRYFYEDPVEQIYKGQKNLFLEESLILDSNEQNEQQELFKSNNLENWLKIEQIYETRIAAAKASNNYSLEHKIRIRRNAFLEMRDNSNIYLSLYKTPSLQTLRKRFRGTISTSISSSDSTYRFSDLSFTPDKVKCYSKVPFDQNSYVLGVVKAPDSTKSLEIEIGISGLITMDEKQQVDSCSQIQKKLFGGVMNASECNYENAAFRVLFQETSLTVTPLAISPSERYDQNSFLIPTRALQYSEVFASKMYDKETKTYTTEVEQLSNQTVVVCVHGKKEFLRDLMDEAKSDVYNQEQLIVGYCAIPICEVLRLCKNKGVIKKHSFKFSPSLDEIYYDAFDEPQEFFFNKEEQIEDIRQRIILNVFNYPLILWGQIAGDNYGEEKSQEKLLEEVIEMKRLFNQPEQLSKVMEKYQSLSQAGTGFDLLPAFMKSLDDIYSTWDEGVICTKFYNFLGISNVSCEEPNEIIDYIASLNDTNDDPLILNQFEFHKWAEKELQQRSF